MRSLILGLIALFTMIGCESLRPKGIGLDIEFTKAPTAKEAKEWRRLRKWERGIVLTPAGEDKAGWINEKHQVLINGTPVDKAKHPAVIRISNSTGGSCTAAIVNPQTILTAAHCAKTGEKVTFKTFDGRSWSAIMTQYENWSKDDDLDLNIGRVNAPITGIKPLSVRTDRFEKVGTIVEMIGYGCINPGGTGGNDGILRGGKAQVTEETKKFKYDLVTNGAPPEFSAVCYGDSGGPVLFDGRLVGVNSKGNIEDKNYTTRTTVEGAKAWLEKIAAAVSPICGVNAQCDGSEPPPPPPGPKQFVFENDLVKIQGILK